MTLSPQDFQQMIFAELSEEIRSRREPEHLYTAAAIGAFGAIAWGVATIATVTTNKNPVAFYQHPALVAAGACVILTVAVIAKIVREHKKYVDLRREQIKLAQSLAESCSFDRSNLPPGLHVGKESGPGYLWSTGVVVCAAVGAIAFCVSVWMFK